MTRPFSVLPREVVTDVVESYAEPEEVIQRRRLGPEWYTRYLQLLPEIAGEDWVKKLALDTRDEDLLFDVLQTNPDLHDIWNYSGSLWLLGSTIEHGFSLAFGKRLLQIPIFLANLVGGWDDLWLHNEWAQEGIDEPSIERRQEINRKIGSATEDLLYYPAIATTILIPYIRRKPFDLPEIFLNLRDPEVGAKLLDLMERRRLTLEAVHLDETADNLEHREDGDWGDVIERLRGYPYRF